MRVSASIHGKGLMSGQEAQELHNLNLLAR